MIGEEISQYILIDRLGSGGMGEVYLAMDRLLNRRVAIKVLSQRLASDWTANRYLRREAQAAAGLDHPNICTVHEVGDYGDSGFIAMQYVEGENLASIIKREPLSEDQALSVACQLADALAAAHSVGIIHRDIKPHNIMLTPKGQLKVLDFGLATRLESPSLSAIASDPMTPLQAHEEAEINGARAEADEEKTVSLIAEVGVPEGTVPYMSPEQLRGEILDERTDIFSFGAVMFEVLTGKRLFARETVGELKTAILTEAMPELPIGEGQKETIGGLQVVLQKCLAKERTDRYESGVELAADLRQLENKIASRRQGGTPREWLTLPRLIKVAAASLVILLVLTAVYAKFVRRSTPPAASPSTVAAKPPVDSIAVLPFKNGDASASGSYLSDGLTVSLINQLSQIPTLKVIARNSVFRYKGQDVDAKTVGQQLNVTAVLVGSIEEQADHLEVSLTLSDTSHNNTLWTKHFASERRDALKLQSNILRDVTEELRPQSSASLQERFQRRNTKNDAAYAHYLKGIFDLNKRTPDGVNGALESFQKAVDLDPEYALAFAGLADAYSLLDDFSMQRPSVSMSLAESAAKRALAIDPSLGEAHSTLALINRDFRFDWTAAEQELKEALKLNPNYAITYNRYGWFLISLGRFDEALMYMRKAQELDPRSLNLNTALGLPYYYDQHYDKAIEEYQRTLQLDKDFYPANLYLGLAYVAVGKHKEAIKIFQRLRKINKGPDIEVCLGYAYARAGQKNKTQAILSSFKKMMSQGRYVPPYDLALLYAQLQDKDQAMSWLEKAYQEHEMASIIKVEPMLIPLRSDARFNSFLQSLRLAD